MAKRVSADEKLLKVTNFFRSKPEFYSLKELEKKLPKECGISSMQVSDILQNAIDENLIHCEKVGTSNVYWSFKNEMYHYYSCENDKCIAGIESYREQNNLKQKQLDALLLTNEDNEERQHIQSEYLKLKEIVEKHENEKYMADKYSKKTYDEICENLNKNKIAINQIMDNIYALKWYVCKKYNFDKNEFDKTFEINEDCNYVD